MEALAIEGGGTAAVGQEDADEEEEAGEGEEERKGAVEEDVDCCAICLEPLPETFGGEDPPYVTPCQHTFHRGCVMDNALYHLERGTAFCCPMCRGSLRLDF
jgi:hypothetical protein